MYINNEPTDAISFSILHGVPRYRRRSKYTSAYGKLWDKLWPVLRIKLRLIPGADLVVVSDNEIGRAA